MQTLSEVNLARVGRLEVESVPGQAPISQLAFCRGCLVSNLFRCRFLDSASVKVVIRFVRNCELGSFGVAGSAWCDATLGIQPLHECNV